MTHAERCKLATDCLPVAGYRRRLEELHAEMLAEIEQLRSYMDALNARCVADTEEIGRLRAVIAEWEKLRDPATLHHNLLRDFPARLSRDALLHLAGDDTVARAALGE